MTDGALLISNGWLPDDREAGRQGRPDLLLRMVDSDGRGYYVPGDIKAHKTLNTPRRNRRRSRLPGDPAEVFSVPGLSPMISSRLDDFLQLAHYSRMLDAAGFGPLAMRARDSSSEQMRLRRSSMRPSCWRGTS